MTIEEALKTAIEFEQGVKHVYADAAKKFVDPVASKVLKVLASEEERHVEYLESRLTEWQKTGKVTVERLETAIPSKAAIEAGLKQLEKRMGQQDFAIELEVMKKALELEVEATNFFRRMVSELASDERRMFARFVEIEEGHEAIVQAEMDALTGLGYWFDYSEFRLENA
ncbi:MAG: hypothetical protein AB1714_01895 [Acidobacteriota bacterium]